MCVSPFFFLFFPSLVFVKEIQYLGGKRNIHRSRLNDNFNFQRNGDFIAFETDLYRICGIVTMETTNELSIFPCIPIGFPFGNQIFHRSCQRFFPPRFRWYRLREKVLSDRGIILYRRNWFYNFEARSIFLVIFFSLLCSCGNGSLHIIEIFVAVQGKQMYRQLMVR